MIHKIERLISIGKYRNYQATGDVSFKKCTLFYGDNGGGKTTLTAILRSLAQNRPELLTRRKSTNQNNVQEAQIVERTATGDISHTFNTIRGWTIPFPNIEIFDIHFVNENVYSGFDFNDDHKKRLHQFVIGAVGVSIQKQIEQNKAAKVLSRENQLLIENQLIQKVGNNLTADIITSFLGIPSSQANGIDQQIAAAEAALVSANANSIIQNLQTLSTLTPISTGIDFASLSIDLQTTSQAIQNATLESLFVNHCQDLTDNGIEGSENWLKRGFEYVGNKHEGGETSISCPFCKQTIGENVEILNAYISKFDADFNALVLRLQSHFSSLQNFNSEAIIQEFNNVNQKNSTSITLWSAHLPNTVVQPIFKIISEDTNLKNELQSLITLVQQKIQNPTIALDITNVTIFQSSCQTINTNIDFYNKAVIAYNASIAAFRLSIQTPASAKLALDNFKRIKQRFETPIEMLCSELKAEKQALRELETAYTALSLQQQSESTTFFSNYKNRINHYLSTVFKTLFRIEDVVHVPPQGRGIQSKIGYKLTIDGQDISFDPEQTNNAKDSLSEGDKSTIALAFFLSKIDIESSITDKILVFDDPLSSFDSNRRMYTVQLIKDLFPKIKQVIVLSHNEYFLHELSKNFNPGDKKTLRITENFLTKASIIEPLVLESMVENDYFKHIKELEKFLQNPDLNNKEIVLSWLRNVLESHIRFKFYRQLSGLAANKQTLGTLITTLVTQNVIFRDNENRISIISKLNLINGISCKPHHGEPLPDYSILGLNPNNMNVTELANFINDTLDLVDNLL